MYLYVIENADQNCVKLGYSRDPYRRCAGLQTGSSDDLRVAYSVPVPEDRVRLLERRLHRELNHYRKKGEWFSISPEFARAQVDHLLIRWQDDPLL